MPTNKTTRKNRYAGILQPRLVGEGAPEVSVLVLYDIENDKIRNRVADVCLNYGLERIQFSAFLGKINRNRRQELSIQLQDEVGDEVARIRVIPITEDSLKDVWVLDQYSKSPAGAAPGKPLPALRVVDTTGRV